MKFDRRDILRMMGVQAASLGLSGVSLGSPGPTKTLVVLFLRGGVDGLSVVAPYGHAGYRKARPSIAIPAPGQPNGALKLTDGFGLHPQLADLMPAWQAKELAIVHAAGLPVAQRSHFEAQDLMESGRIDRVQAKGWAGRVLEGDALFEGIAVQDQLPLALQGAPGALALGRAIRSPKATPTTRVSVDDMRHLYEAGDGPLRRSGRLGLDALKRTKRLLQQPAKNGAKYAKKGAAARGLFTIARVVEAQVGLRIAWVDVGGWDTHNRQGTSERGSLANNLNSLGKALAAFRTDLGPLMEDVVVTVTTEFGRTWNENGAQGTDHGRGSVFLAMGGPIQGGKILGKWPIKDPNYSGRELPVVTDTRDLYGELVRGHLGVTELGGVFPGHSLRPVGLLGPR